MSAFDQIVTGRIGKLASGFGARGVCAMSVTDEFWQYAKEAALAACYAESDDEKQGLLDLAQTWTQAALIERRLRSIRAAWLSLRKVISRNNRRLRALAR